MLTALRPWVENSWNVHIHHPNSMHLLLWACRTQLNICDPAHQQVPLMRKKPQLSLMLLPLGHDSDCPPSVPLPAAKTSLLVLEHAIPHMLPPHSPYLGCSFCLECLSICCPPGLGNLPFSSRFTLTTPLYWFLVSNICPLTSPSPFISWSMHNFLLTFLMNCVLCYLLPLKSKFHRAEIFEYVGHYSMISAQEYFLSD
jgi:hypothetical protein